MKRTERLAGDGHQRSRLHGDSEETRGEDRPAVRGDRQRRPGAGVGADIASEGNRRADLDQRGEGTSSVGGAVTSKVCNCPATSRV